MEDGMLAGKREYSLNKISLDKSQEKFDDLIKNLQGRKLGSIKEVIEDIEELIKIRNELHIEMSKDLEKIKSSLSNTLLQYGSNPELSREILDLKKKMIEIDELVINEKLNNFRDIALLKQELRERVKEAKERESRMEVLDNILSE